MSKRIVFFLMLGCAVVGLSSDIMNMALAQGSAGNTVSNEVRALLLPEREAVISSLLTSRIHKIHVKDGDRFKKHQVLITFWCDEQRAAYAVSRARLKQYTTEYRANLELIKQQAVSRFDVQLAKAKQEEGQAVVSGAKAKLKKCQVVAPYNGKVVKVHVHDHESAEVGKELIAILNDETFKMTLHVPSLWTTKISKGMDFKVKIDETRKAYQAKVKSITPRIDPTSRTLELTAEIVGRHKELRAGMSGRALLGPFK